MGKVSLGTLTAASLSIQAVGAQSEQNENTWKPVSERKVRVGIVGYGVCRFGAAFGFQDHPNVEVVAVSDLIPERREGLMKACRCNKSYESLGVLVKDPKIGAVFVATDAPNHARHCIEVLKHEKHVMTAVPAVLGSLEDAEQLLDVVKKVV
ncbi:MAG: Gfo/Idh/MocA family oxidoreductase [Sedimentisphaerales bacterium]|nr:Gfo/Idh/MocA family oxidoreductase [Sedimentisphaerales bacterium]